MKKETWMHEHDVMGWACSECGHWENFTDAAEGDEHLCEGEFTECSHCNGSGGAIGYVNGVLDDEFRCPECNGKGEVPAKGKMVEAWG